MQRLIITPNENQYVLGQARCDMDFIAFLDRKLKKTEPVSEREMKQTVSGASKGLLYLHEHRLLHRDIKPENILLVIQNEQICAKLCDFGFVSRFGEAGSNIVGTDWYFAPELSRDDRVYDVFTDIWALGVVIMEVVTFPFSQPHVCRLINTPEGGRIIAANARDFTQSLGRMHPFSVKMSLYSALKEKYKGLLYFMGNAVFPAAELGELPWRIQLMICGAAFMRRNPTNRMSLNHFIGLSVLQNHGPDVE